MPNMPIAVALFVLIVAATAALAWAIWRAERRDGAPSRSDAQEP